MIGIFKQKSPANLVVLLIFGLLIKMPLFLHPKNIELTAQDGKLYRYLISLISTPGANNGLTYSLFAFFLIYGQALLVNYLVNEQRMTNRQTFLPAMAYIMITSLLPEWSYLSAALITSTLIIWILIKVFKLYNAGAVSGSIFNIGLLLGISSFIYFPSVAFLLCILLGIMILRALHINEFVLLLLGILAPYYFSGIYLFLNDNLTIANISPHLTIQFGFFKSTIWMAFAVLLLGVPFLMGGYFVQTHLGKMLIQARKNWSVLLLYLVISLVIPFLNSANSLENWVLVAAPFATFHAGAYLYPRKSIIPLILFFLTLAFILYQQYGTTVWRG